MGMLLAWLLPDDSYLLLLEGWVAQPYLARHGRTPALLRLARSAASRPHHLKWTKRRPKFFESFSTR